MEKKLGNKTQVSVGYVILITWCYSELWDVSALAHQYVFRKWHISWHSIKLITLSLWCDWSHKGSCRLSGSMFQILLFPACAMLQTQWFLVVNEVHLNLLLLRKEKVLACHNDLSCLLTSVEFREKNPTFYSKNTKFCFLFFSIGILVAYVTFITVLKKEAPMKFNFR